MNIKEALKIILCDSQKGVDYNKFIKGKDYILRFNENESYSARDCNTIHKIEIYCNCENYLYLLDSIILCDSYNKKNYVDESEIDEFLKRQYLFKNEDVEIKEFVEKYNPNCGKSVAEWCDEE